MKAASVGPMASSPASLSPLPERFNAASFAENDFQSSACSTPFSEGGMALENSDSNRGIGQSSPIAPDAANFRDVSQERLDRSRASTIPAPPEDP